MPPESRWISHLAQFPGLRRVPTLPSNSVRMLHLIDTSIRGLVMRIARVRHTLDDLGLFKILQEACEVLELAIQCVDDFLGIATQIKALRDSSLHVVDEFLVFQ